VLWALVCSVQGYLIHASYPHLNFNHCHTQYKYC
jgi:hypothetical protein